MLERIYLLSPYFIKFILFNIKAFINYLVRYSGSFEKYFKEYKDNLNADNLTLNNIQKNEIRYLLLECFNFSKWYKEKMNSLHITEELITNNPLEALIKMPILKKEERKKFVDEIVNNNPKRKTIEIGYTSGTSGSPTKNYLDIESIRRSMAFWKRFHYSINIKRNIRQIRFSGNAIVGTKKKTAPFWMNNIFEKQLFFSTYHLNKINSSYFINKLNNYKPEILDGYPSALYEISKFILESKKKLEFTPLAVITTAETLYSYQRITIEKAFNCNLFNQYASSEGSPFITECLFGNLHLNVDSGYFEILNSDNKNAKPGEIGRLVITSFRNIKTPLIRYDIEDLVLLPKKIKKCLCGCKMPIIEKIIGREDDLLITENGTLIGMMAFKIFKKSNNIIKGQIIQKTRNEVVINVEVTKKFNNIDSIYLKSKVKDYLGESINANVNIMNEIPLGENGKFNPVKRLFEIK